LKEQNKYDQMPLGIFDRLQRILPLMDKVADDIMCKETEILKKVIPRMFEVMHMTLKVSCDYIKRGRFGKQLSFRALANANGRRENAIWAY
jgi:hypothetical protein